MSAPETDTEGKFSLGHEHECSGPDSTPVTQEGNPRPPWVSQKVNLLSILLPMLLIVVLAIVYLDVKSNLTILSDSGSQSIQGLSTDLQSRFSSLSIQYAKLDEASNQRSRDLEESLKRQVVAMEKDSAAVKGSLQATEKALQALGSSKLNTDEYRKVAGETEKNIKSLQDLTTATVARMGAFEAEHRKVIGDLLQSAQVLQKEIGQLRSEMAAQQAAKIDKDAVASALASQKESYQQMLNLLTRKLEGRIESLEEKLAQMERLSRTPAVPARSPVTTTPPASGGLPPAEPLGPTRRAIVEQNIPD